MQYRKHKAMRGGFTLVELSIVLVILGLLAGGVLAGQKLIAAAELRATMEQFRRYSIAAATFEEKYAALPGDLPNAQDHGLEAYPAVWAGQAAWGDGNGVIESGVPTACANPIAEVTMFWRHLSQAGLIEGNYNGLQDSYTQARKVGETFPFSRNKKQGGLTVCGSDRVNYFELGVQDTPASTGTMNQTRVLTPREAYGIDKKMDDGKPHSGIVMARAGVYINYQLGADQVDNTAPYTGCVDLDASTPANVRDAIYTIQNDQVICGLRVPMQ